MHMTALMEIVAVPHIQQTGADILQDEYAINSDGPLSSINSIDSPTQFRGEDVDFFQKTVEPPKCAEGRSYCENVESYPYDIVERLLENTTLLFDDPSEIESMNVEIEKKHSDDLEVPCKSIRRNFRPQQGRLTRDNEWMSIVNTENKQQIVQIEECRHNKQCQLEDIGDFARCLGYESTCVQRYMQVKLHALESMKKPVTEHFEMPSSCECVFKRTENWRAINSCRLT